MKEQNGQQARTRQCRTSVRGRDFALVKGLPTALVITAENDYCVMKARLMPIRGKTSVNIRPNYWRKIEVDYEG
jgi:hypothetical protein